MRLAGRILSFVAVAALCLAGWLLLTGYDLWGYQNRHVVAVTLIASQVLILLASAFSAIDRRRRGDERRDFFATLVGSKAWTTAGGVSVILLTGVAALVGISGVFDGSWVGAGLGIFLIVATVGGAFALHTFISRHGDEIGEARFDTRNRDDRNEGR